MEENINKITYSGISLDENGKNILYQINKQINYPDQRVRGIS